MNLVADSHAWAGYAGDDERLSPTARAAMLASATTTHVSIASVWELSIKRSLGKASGDIDIVELVELSRREALIQFLTIEVEDAVSVVTLPMHHRDPFDRLIIAQAVRRDWTIITVDPQCAAYGVKTLW